MRLKTSESGTEEQYMRRDLRVGDNPCSCAKETRLSYDKVVLSRNSVMWQKERTQASAYVLAVVTAVRLNSERTRAWCAGELEGSGNAFTHDRMGDSGTNWTSKKRCRRARGTHDFDTVQHALSEVRSSYKWSTMRSSISGGRAGGRAEEDMIVVLTKALMER